MVTKITGRDLENLCEIADKLQFAKFRAERPMPSRYYGIELTPDIICELRSYVGDILDAVNYFEEREYCPIPEKKKGPYKTPAFDEIGE